MSLLIFNAYFILQYQNSVFTFQYVSINIKTFLFQLPAVSHLHSNMSLLILGYTNGNGKVGKIFTFQYVSINMDEDAQWDARMENLHSNMSLLILLWGCGQASASVAFTFQYVSINM